MELFITYAHEDLIKVRELAELLTAGRHTVWFDNQLLPGQDWKLELENAIARCDAFVYALTKAAVTSEWCEWELATAARLRKAVVPILFEGAVVVPQQLQSLQYADFQYGPTALATAKLFAALMSMQKIPFEQSPPIPADPKGIPSRAWEHYRHWTDLIVAPTHQPQNDAEEIQGKFSARWMEIGGRIIITNERVLWEPSNLNFGFGRDLNRARERPIDIPLRDISDIVPDPGGWECFTVHRCSGESYTFFVVPWFRKRIIALIERQRSFSNE